MDCAVSCGPVYFSVLCWSCPMFRWFWHGPAPVTRVTSVHPPSAPPLHRSRTFHYRATNVIVEILSEFANLDRVTEFSREGRFYFWSLNSVPSQFLLRLQLILNYFSKNQKEHYFFGVRNSYKQFCNKKEYLNVRLC